MQIILTRDHVSIPWGFRLKGGAEYNVPLSILKVNEGSPSHHKLECGDVIASIGSYPALNLKHEEALNIIRMFDVSLPLVIQRDQSAFFSAAQNKQTVWRPASAVQNLAKSTFSVAPSQPSYNQSFGGVNPHHSPSSPRTQSTFANHPANVSYSAYSPSNQFDNQVNHYQIPISSQNFYQPTAQPNLSKVSEPIYFHPNSTNFNQTKNIASPNNSNTFMMHNTPPQISPPAVAAPPPPPPPPPAPPLPSSFSTPNSYKESNIRPSQVHQAQQQQQVVPDALLKAMNGAPGSGRKPFTYTPGGLDLSHVRESARVKRHESMSQENKIRQQSLSSSPYVSSSNDNNFSTTVYQAPTPQQSPGPKFSIPTSPSLNKKVSASSTNLAYDSSVPSTPRVPPPPASLASMKTNSTSTANINFDSVPTTPKFNIPNKPPNPYSAPTGGFSVTPDQLVKPKKDENRDFHNQSFSFRMLNRWIEESESSGIMVSKKDEEEKEKEKETERNKLKKSAVIKAIEEEEKNIAPTRQSPNLHTKFVTAPSPTPFTAPQVQYNFQNNYNSHQSVNYFPSKVFQYIDRKFSNSSSESNLLPFKPNSINDQTSTYKIPAREREQEAGPSKYKGTHIPSKTFKYLQYLTDNEAVIDNSNLNTTKSQPASSYTDASNTYFSQPAVTQQKTNTVQFAATPQELNTKPNHFNNNDNLYTAVPTQTTSSFSAHPYTSNSSVSNLKSNFQNHDSRISVSSFSNSPSSISSKKNSNTVTFAQSNYSNNEFNLNNSVNLAKTISNTNDDNSLLSNTETSSFFSAEPYLSNANVLNVSQEIKDKTNVDTLESSNNDTLADVSAFNHTLASSADFNALDKNDIFESEPEPLATKESEPTADQIPITTTAASSTFAIAQLNDDTAIEPTDFSSSISNNETINTIINLNDKIEHFDNDEQSTVVEDSSSSDHHKPGNYSTEQKSTTSVHETVIDNQNGVEEHITTTITTTTSTFETLEQNNDHNELNQLIKEIETSSSNNNNHEASNENNAQDEERIETSEF